MTLPTTGKISLGDVNVEMALARTAPTRLNNATVRALAQKASGKISLADLRGKAYSAPANADAIQVTAGSTTDSYAEYIGCNAWSTTPIGSVSPATYKTYALTGFYVQRQLTDSVCSMVVTFTSSTAAPGNTVKGLTLGGLYINSGLVNAAGDAKIMLASVRVTITLAQFNAVKAAIAGKTTTGYIHY